MNMRKQQVFTGVVLLAFFVGCFVIVINSSSDQVTSFISCQFRDRSFEDKKNKSDDWKHKPLENWTIQQIIDYFLWTNSTSCLLSNDFGGFVIANEGVTGQKAVCLDPQIAPEKTGGFFPVHTENKSSECLIYSFGINDEWSFDEHMEQLGCRIYAFDPSMNATNHNHSDKIHFYNLGLSDRDEIVPRKTPDKNDWEMKSLDYVYYKMLHHGSRIIDYLKIDIEGDEWKVLPQMMSTGMLNRVRQLGIEIHLVPEEETTLEIVRQRVKIVKTLEDEYGFFRFDSKYAPFHYDWKIIDNYETEGRYQFEMSFYNSRLLRRLSEDQ